MKQITTKMKLLYIAFCGATLVSCYPKIEEHCIIPHGYKGQVVVVYNQRCGDKAQISPEGYKIYRIPTNGILITSEKFSKGTKNRKYFTKNSDGSLTEIIKMEDVEDRPPSNNHAILGRTGVYMQGTFYAVDNGYDAQSVLILNYNELQDSLKSQFFDIRNQKSIEDEILKCNNTIK